MVDDYYMKTPCKDCPFRRDVRPFLHPDRAFDIASSASNPYNSFTCHKTLEHDDDHDDGFVGASSKECAGFLTMRANETDEGLPDGFEPSWELCYTDVFEMEYEYEQEWNKERRA